MNVLLQVVDTNFVHQIWPKVSGYLESAIVEGEPYPEETRNYNLEHVKMYVSTGQWALLTAVDELGDIVGAGALALYNYPCHRAAFVTLAGGKFLSGSNVAAQLKDIAKHYGATKLQFYCRESMARLMQRVGYERRNVMMEMMV